MPNLLLLHPRNWLNRSVELRRHGGHPRLFLACLTQHPRLFLAWLTQHPRLFLAWLTVCVHLNDRRHSLHILLYFFKFESEIQHRVFKKSWANAAASPHQPHL